MPIKGFSVLFGTALHRPVYTHFVAAIPPQPLLASSSVAATFSSRLGTSTYHSTRAFASSSCSSTMTATASSSASSPPASSSSTAAKLALNGHHHHSNGDSDSAYKGISPSIGGAQNVEWLKRIARDFRSELSSSQAPAAVSIRPGPSCHRFLPCTSGLWSFSKGQKVRGWPPSSRSSCCYPVLVLASCKAPGQAGGSPSALISLSLWWRDIGERTGVTWPESANVAEVWPPSVSSPSPLHPPLTALRVRMSATLVQAAAELLLLVVDPHLIG